MNSSNGTPQQVSREDVRQAKLRLALTEASIKQAQLDRAKRLTESAYWQMQFTDILAQRLDRSFQVGGDGSQRSNRRGGGNYPIFQNETELANLRDRARILVDVNEYAQGLVEGLTSYVIGDGCTYRVTSKDDAPDELVAACQDIVDDFLDKNDWHGGEQPSVEEELFRRSVRDGEFFILHYLDPNGSTTIRIVEPEYVTGQSHTGDPDWAFGILNATGDVATHLAYYIQDGDTPTAGSEYDADRVTHFRRNVDRNIKRGLTDFCGGTLDALHNASQLRKFMTEGAAIQATYAGIRQHKNASQAQIRSLQSQVADYVSTNPTNGQSEYYQRLKPGMVDIPDGMEFAQPPTATNAASHVAILQACLRGAGRKWCAPEWLASGDAANANYASSLVAASDFVKTVERRQKQYSAVFAMSVWRALRNWVETKGLTVRMVSRDENGRDTGSRSERTFTWAEVHALIDLQTEAPSPVANDKLSQAQADQIYCQLKVKSPQTIMAEQGLDSEQELVNFETFAERLGEIGAGAFPLPGEPGGAPGQQEPSV